MKYKSQREIVYRKISNGSPDRWKIPARFPFERTDEWEEIKHCFAEFSERFTTFKRWTDAYIQKSGERVALTFSNMTDFLDTLTSIYDSLNPGAPELEEFKSAVAQIDNQRPRRKLPPFHNLIRWIREQHSEQVPSPGEALRQSTVSLGHFLHQLQDIVDNIRQRIDRAPYSHPPAEGLETKSTAVLGIIFAQNRDELSSEDDQDLSGAPPQIPAPQLEFEERDFSAVTQAIGKKWLHLARAMRGLAKIKTQYPGLYELTRIAVSDTTKPTSTERIAEALSTAIQASLQESLDVEVGNDSSAQEANDHAQAILSAFNHDLKLGNTELSMRDLLLESISDELSASAPLLRSALYNTTRGVSYSPAEWMKIQSDSYLLLSNPLFRFFIANTPRDGYREGRPTEDILKKRHHLTSMVLGQLASIQSPVLHPFMHTVYFGSEQRLQTDLRLVCLREIKTKERLNDEAVALLEAGKKIQSGDADAMTEDAFREAYNKLNTNQPKNTQTLELLENVTKHLLGLSRILDRFNPSQQRLVFQGFAHGRLADILLYLRPQPINTETGVLLNSENAIRLRRGIDRYLDKSGFTLGYDYRAYAAFAKHLLALTAMHPNFYAGILGTVDGSTAKLTAVDFKTQLTELIQTSFESGADEQYGKEKAERALGILRMFDTQQYSFAGALFQDHLYEAAYLSLNRNFDYALFAHNPSDVLESYGEAHWRETALASHNCLKNPVTTWFISQSDPQHWDVERASRETLMQRPSILNSLFWDLVESGSEHSLQFLRAIYFATDSSLLETIKAVYLEKTAGGSALDLNSAAGCIIENQLVRLSGIAEDYYNFSPERKAAALQFAAENEDGAALTELFSKVGARVSTVELVEMAEVYCLLTSINRRFLINVITATDFTALVLDEFMNSLIPKPLSEEGIAQLQGPAKSDYDAQRAEYKKLQAAIDQWRVLRNLRLHDS